LGQEAGGHLVGEASEVVMDLDLQSGELGGVVSQSIPPLRLEGLGLLTEGTEEIVTGGDQRTGLGLETHLHGQLTIAVLRESRPGLSGEGHDIRSRGQRTLFGNRPRVMTVVVCRSTP
jgi:ribosomal protein S6E (S10)